MNYMIKFNCARCILNLGNEADEEDATENGQERWLLDGGTIENSDEE